MFYESVVLLAALLERVSDQCTDSFFVAERRLSLGRRFNAGAECGRNL
jgi:hypothetical protein